SRRRHTRSYGDWSSDVCSSDLALSADSFAASIDWGDGTTSGGTVTGNAVGGYSVTGNHVYAEEGRYTTTIAITVGGLNSSGVGEIGRASCRERVEIEDGGGSLN